MVTPEGFGPALVEGGMVTLEGVIIGLTLALLAEGGLLYAWDPSLGRGRFRSYDTMTALMLAAVGLVALRRVLGFL